MVSFFHVSTPLKNALVDVTVIQIGDANPKVNQGLNARATKLDKKFFMVLED